MEPLSDVIALLRPHAAISKPITARGEWGVCYEAYEQPGFALVLDGQCWVALGARAPVRLARGDFVLLPATPAFSMTSRPGAECVAARPAATPVRHGLAGGEPDFRMLGGSFRIEPANAPLLVALLPELIHVQAADTTSLSRVVGLIRDECEADRPGGEMILRRLLEVMLIEALRRETISEEGSLEAGLLAGLRDPAVARALRALHADVGRRWTVASLAQIACLSRSAFAARFRSTVGCAPMEYLARWRMARARDALGRGGMPLDRLAEEVGYESASAFSTAFRRRVGCAPGGFARSLQ
ncbi:MAG: AraC family transcriptional regulator [Allosphingosinicella sp.]